MRKERNREVLLFRSMFLKQNEYWVKKLSGEFDATDISSSFEQGNPTREGSGKVEIYFQDELCSQILMLSKRSDLSIYILLLSALKSLIFRYTANEDIIVISPVYRHKIREETINNLVFIRDHVDSNLTFKELVLEARNSVLEAYENQDYPYDKIVEYLFPPPGKQNEQAISKILCSLGNLHNDRNIKKIDAPLSFRFLRTGDRINGYVIYDGSTCNENEVVRFSNHFINLLTNAVENVSVKISEISFLTEQEKKQLLVNFNDNKADFSKHCTIYRFIEEYAAKMPDTVAITFMNAEITYRDLNRRTNHLAKDLRDKGIREDQPVGILLDRSPRMVESILASWKAGGAYIPLDTKYPQQRVLEILKDSQSRVLITGSGHVNPDLEASYGGVIIEWHEQIDQTVMNGGNSNLEMNMNNLSYVIYTSGSTGKPKGVIVEHIGMMNHIAAKVHDLQLTGISIIAQTASHTFDISIWQFFAALTQGGKTVIYPDESVSDPEQFISRIINHRVTILEVVPSYLSVMLVFLDINSRELQSLKYLLVTGETIKPRMVKRWFEKYPEITMVNAYGPTEASDDITHFVMNKAPDGARIPIGTPICNLNIYIVDKNMNLCPVGVKGEICVSGVGVGRGYLNNPGLTRERFLYFLYKSYKSYRTDIPQRIYKTGDLGRWLSDGTIEFFGRKDYQVKIRGFRIELGEIETHLSGHPLIKEAVVDVKEVGSGGSAAEWQGEKYLAAYVVTVTEKKLDVPLIKDYLAKRLPDYMVPEYFVELEQMPLTPNGKIDRKALYQMEVDLFIKEKYVAPRDNTEEEIAEIWSELLGKEKEDIGIDTNFFEQGGHSLSATIMAAKVHRKFNVMLSITEVFRTPTIRGLSERIKGLTEDKYVSIPPVEEREFYHLSSAQKRLYALQQMNDRGIAYNIPSVWILEGNPDKDRLENTLKHLIERHDSLRTSFEMIEGEPVQRIHDEVELVIGHWSLVTGKDDDVVRMDSIIKDFVRPFDLSRSPLLRIGLIKIETQKNILMLDMHHIISDGTSTVVFAKEFMSIYGREVLPQLKMQYKDFSQWQKSKKHREAIKQQEEYWLKEFSGQIPVLNLPIDYSRPVIRSFEGRTLNFEIGKEDTRALRTYALKEGGTLFMVLLSIYTIFLSKLSSQEDITVGTPMAGRTHGDLENIIGMFVNTLALRNFPRGDHSFTHFLLEVKDRALAAFAHQDYPYEDLVEAVVKDRNTARNPLFDTLFALQNIDTSKIEIPGLKLKPYDYEGSVSKFDLTLVAMELKENLLFTFEYNTRLFKKETIERFIKYFQKTITDVLREPNKKISGIEIITGEERKQVLYDFNDTEAEFLKNKMIHQLFEEQVERTPNHIAVIGSSQMKYRTYMTYMTYISYRELNQKSRQLAFQLKERGVMHDTIVGLTVERSVEMIIGIFGIMKAGGAYLPIDPNYPEERIDFMLKDSGAEILLKDNYFTPEAFNNRPKGTSPHLHLPPAPATSLAYIIYTSGSTGKPKGVMIEHLSLVNRLNWMQKKYPLDKDDTILHKTPFTFDVSVWEIFWWSFIGAKLCLLAPGGEKEPAIIIDTIEKNNVTVMHFVPAMLNAFLAYLPGSGEVKKLSCLKQVIASGEALMLSHVKRFSEILRKENSIPLANLYGPTEATIDVSYYNCFESETGESECIPIGKPIDNIRLYILDNHRHIQPVGIAGELYISGVGLARGYLNRPALTSEKFRLRRPGALFEKTAPGPRKNFLLFPPHSPYSPYSPHSTIYRTGDLARWMKDGNIEFLGRIDHQVKIRGFRIEPDEIAARLLKHSKIKEAVVIDRQTSGENHDSETHLCAYIVMEKDHDLPSFLPQLRAFLSRVLPYYMIPTYFVRLERVPLTPNGKVDRKVLPEPEKKIGAVYTAPRDEIEEKLAHLWEDVLGVEKVGINENFFNIGGDSIRAIKLLSLINIALDTHLRAVDLVANETIEKLAGRIKQHQTIIRDVEYQKVLTGIAELKTRILSENKLEGAVEDIYPMSDVEKGIVFHYLKDSGEAFYHDQFPYILSYRNFDPQIFKNALALMVQKHSILRTGFNLDGFEESVQIVYKEVNHDVEHCDISDKAPLEQQEYLTRFMEEDRKKTFDVGMPPLWRMRIFGLGNERICAIWIFHHAILDGWSVASLMTELNNTYLTLKSNPQYVPEKLKISYKDFVVEQILEKEKTGNLEYWKNELEDYKRLSFPVLLENEKGSTKGIKIYRNNIGLTVLEELRKVAKKYNTSIKHLCFGAYVYMLSMLSFENDIAPGLVTENRPISEDGDKLVGCFLNTVPVRVKIPADITWADYIIMMDKKLKELAKYNRVSLYEIVRMIGEKPQDENPVFDTLFNYIDYHVYGQALQDDVKTSAQTSKEEEIVIPEVYENTNTLLVFTISTTFPGFSLFIPYKDSVIREEGVEKLCNYFKTILEKFIHEPKRLARKSEILPPGEKQKVLYEFNDTKTGYSRDKTIHRLFEEQVEKTPGNIAVMFDGKTLNYKELNEKTNQLAQELRTRGIGPNRFVGVVMERSMEMVIGVMAILKAGGAYVPVEPHLPEARISTCLSAVKAESLITNRMQLSKIGTVCEKLPEVKNIFCLDIEKINDIGTNASFTELFKEKILIFNREIEKNSEKNLVPTATAEDIAYVIFTSGTTGTPKGVMEQHRPVVNLIQWVNTTFQVGGSDKLLFVTSLSFDLSVYDIFGILAAGGAVRVVSSSDLKLPDRLLDIIFEEEITFWDSAPAALQQLVPFIREIDSTRFYTNESQLRLVFLSGDWIPVTIPDILKEAFPGVKFIGLGGATEATVWSNFYPVETVNPYWRSIPYGKPIQNAAYYILDRFLYPCPIDVPGYLYIGGECLSRGYINDETLTTEKFIHSPFVPGEKLYKTGDLARWFPDGNIEFLGRQDNQVKIRGYRIELGEIESQLLNHKEIKEAIVMARDTKTGTKGDKYLCAYYVSDQELLIPSQLSEYLSGTLPGYMIPSYFVKLDKMPVTPNGKLDRKSLPEPGTVVDTEEHTAPGDEIEENMVEIWSELLGLEKEEISINADFFDLGGHSLNATVMVSKIHQIFNVKVELREIFEIPVLKELAAYIKSAARDQYSSIEPAEAKDYYVLSSAQTRLYILQQLELAGTGYNLPFPVFLREDIEIEKLGEIFRKLIARHDSLRTSFEMVNQQPVQRIHDPRDVEFQVEYYDLSSERQTSDMDEEKLVNHFVRPFDLSRAPLLRAGLIKTTGGKWLLLLDMHHIVTDAASQLILIEESTALGRGEELPTLRLQYKDYARWQNSREQQELMKQQEAYWVRLFSDELPVLHLPLDHPRPLMQSFEGHTLRFVLNEEETGKAKEISTESNATLYMFLLAAYNILLSKLSSQEDIIVGTPIYARRHHDLQHIVGMFVNTLAMRNYPTGDKTFIEFLKEVTERTLKTYENQEYPFEDLVERISIKRDTSRNPIFDVMFNLFDEPESVDEAPGGLSGDDKENDYEDINNTSKFDLNLTATDMGETLSFQMEYCSKLFKPHSIHRIIKYFKNILRLIFENKEEKLANIEIITREEKKQLLVEFNDTKADFPGDKPLHQLFEEEVKQSPDKTALIFRDRRLTYGELNKRANQLAGHLRIKGIGPDHITGLMTKRSMEMLIGIIAIIKAGGAYLPIDPEYPEERIKYMLEDSAVKLLLINYDKESELKQIPGKVEHINLGDKNIYCEESRIPNDINKAADLVYLIYTSGSTGKPKAVIIEHHSLVNRLNWMQKKYPIDKNDTILHKTPFTFDVSVWEIFWWAVTGAKVYLLVPGGEKEPGIIIDAIEKNNVTVMHFVPSMLSVFLDYLQKKGDEKKLSCLKQVIASGETLMLSHVKRFSEILSGENSTKLANLYGPTEATIDVSYYDCFEKEELESIPIGKPIDNIRLYIVDKHLHMQPVGIPGQLCIAGEGLSRGYLNRPELTAEKFDHDLRDYKDDRDKRKKVPDESIYRSYKTYLSHIYRTGDLARWLPDGNIDFLGRIDHQVKIRGFRIETGEIETQLMTIDYVKETVVIDRKDEKDDNYLIAYAVSDTDIDASGLRDTLTKTLPHYMVPSYFVQLEEIPLTTSGKVNRKALPAPEIGDVEKAAAPEDEVEEKMVETWANILGLEKNKIGTRANFFELGGHSLKAIILSGKIHEEFNMNISLAEIFKTPTIKGIANLIKIIDWADKGKVEVNPDNVTQQKEIVL